jgi:hypothetical protein
MQVVWRIVVGVGLSGLVAGQALGNGARAEVERVKAEADAAVADGDLEAAARGYGRLAFAGLSGAERRYRRTRREQVKALLEEARNAPNPSQLLQAAHAIDPGSRSVRAALRRQGGSLVAALGGGSSQAPASRREGLGLSASFRVLRAGPFRLFTDVERQGRSALQQMLAAVQSHFRVYCEFMQPLGLRLPREPLDVVLFRQRADYLRVAEAPTASAGVYSYESGASYFYLGERGFDFGILLHEMTHQLNHKVLAFTSVNPWLEEGLAEVFAAGLLTRGGRRYELGRVESGRLVSFRRQQREGELRPLAHHCSQDGFELTNDYYAHSWALVHTLLQEGPVGRMIVFDLLQANRDAEPVSDARQAAIFSRYGRDLGWLERRTQETFSR